MVTDGRVQGLVEREAELKAAGGALDAIERGDGRTIAVEGTAGIGKSALLGAIGGAGGRGRVSRSTPPAAASSRSISPSASRDSSSRRRWRTSVPKRRSRRLRGPRGHPVRAGAADDAAPTGNVSFSVLHGLFWMTLNLAGDDPMLLVVDDLQWCDRSSLRFLAYLAHRLDGTSIGLVTAQRTNEPGVDPALTAGISSEPSSVAIHPRPLSKAGIGELVERQFEQPGDEAFSLACERASGGNPLLLQQTLNALALEGRSPTAGEAGAITDLGPRAVSRTVEARLTGLDARGPRSRPRDRDPGRRQRRCDGRRADRTRAGRGRRRYGRARASRDPRPRDPARLRAPARARGDRRERPAG